MAVVDGDVVLLDQMLAGGEVVDGLVVDVERPVDAAAVACVDVLGVEGKGPEVAAALGREGGGVGVAVVGVRVGDGPAGRIVGRVLARGVIGNLVDCGGLGGRAE